MDGRSVLRVASVADVQAVVQGARGVGARVRVVGTRSVERFLQPQAECWDRVSTVGLGGIAVAGRDFTVRVGAGVTLAELDDALAPLGLVWPVRRLEAPGTVGGLVGSGRGTTITSQDGPARRWVLGARLVDGTGEALTVGGATVKNSVGYGVTHALWGSQGRLGAMVELTLRVRGRQDGDEAPGEVLARDVLDAAAALVRCEDLAPGTAEEAVAGMTGAVRAVGSSDGLRAVGCYLERGVAEADASALKAQGFEAWIEKGARPRAGCAVDPHPSPLPEGERAAPMGAGERGEVARPEVGCAEDPHPDPLPGGEGEGTEPVVSRGVAVVWGALDPDGVFV